MSQFNFIKAVESHHLNLSPVSVETLQVNITKLCNQACHHCHVDSSPKRREMMSSEVIDQCLNLLRDHDEIKTLDITGGAPELHPEFRRMVQSARKLNKKVLVRHNLTVTHDPHPMTKESMAYLPDFFAETGVEVVSSLPYYRQYLTDRQRGTGTFKKSIESLKMLNDRGFGKEGTGLVLDLVYNPVGTYLPPIQQSLELEYKRELKTAYNIDFNHLFAITNLPIHRFKTDLEKRGAFEEYMQKLHSAFNPSAAEGVMCRFMISVSHDGRLYDCDFNQMLNMEIDTPMDIMSFDLEKLKQRKIRFANHCYGCTAGAGSSCGGATA